MGSVAARRRRGTAAFLLTKPFSRAGSGRQGGGHRALLAVPVVAGALLDYTAILFEPLPIAGSRRGRAVWLSLAVFASLTFVASVLTRSALAAGGVGFAALLAAGILSALPGIGPYLPTSLWGAADLLALGTVPDPLAGPVLVNAAIVALALGAAWWSFRRQEL